MPPRLKPDRIDDQHTPPFDFGDGAETAIALSDFETAQGQDVDAFLDAFGVAVTYKPRVGSEREIQAVVKHLGAEELAGPQIGRTAKMTVKVANDSTKGITSREVDTGGDKIAITQRVGYRVVDRRIIGIIKHDAVWMTLGVQ